ncbi:ATP-binding protein [Colwelliaceae bacterium 6441]
MSTGIIRTFRRTFSSIGVKLFLSFWLITISSITITRFVSQQLEQQSIIIPNHQNDIRKLKKIAKRILVQQPANIDDILHYSYKPHGVSILIKDTNSQEVFSNKNRFSQPIASFLNQNSFINHTTVQFPFARLIGPEVIEVNKANYQLYLAVKSKHPHFGSMVMQLPFWLRFIIPVLISISLCWLLARTLTRPILAIKQAATEIGKGNYEARVIAAQTRNDELGEMSRSFNQMAEKLATNIHAHQRLLADVSHELRSPMTRLQIALGLIEQSAQQGKNIDKHLARCTKEINQLDTMIHDVLSLSRMENTFQQTTFVEHDISKILLTAIEDAQYLADKKSITVVPQIGDNCQLMLDKVLILSALSNILINAIKHSEANSHIEVSSKISQQKLIILIADSATGVEETQLELLFKPFYRASTARERESGGTGLGLAIAKQAIDAHHGQISAKNNRSGGLTITIELPLNSSQNN